MKTALYRNLNEGIDIDIHNRIVSFKPNDSTPLNCFTKGEFNNITVWSIFKRFGNRTTYDGNPLIYALKGENGWKFPNKANKGKTAGSFQTRQTKNYSLSKLK